MINNKLTLKSLFLLLASGTVMFAACNKKKNVASDISDDDTDGGYLQDQLLMEKESNDVESIANFAVLAGNVSNFREQNTLGTCVTVYKDTGTNPQHMTIDFGQTNCTCADGRVRRGQILVSYYGNLRDSGSRHVIAYKDYFVNDNQLKGGKTVVNTGYDALSHTKFSITVKDTMLLANKDGQITWSSNRTRTWTAGYDTRNWVDDEYQVAGSADIVRANGKTFHAQTVTPLQIALNCRWISSGILSISTPNGVTRLINYGAGACDDAATLTVKGDTVNIKLKQY